MVELENSGMLVGFIAAEAVDAEKHSMDDPRKQAGWVRRVGRNIEV